MHYARNIFHLLPHSGSGCATMLIRLSLIAPQMFNPTSSMCLLSLAIQVVEKHWLDALHHNAWQQFSVSLYIISITESFSFIKWLDSMRLFYLVSYRFVVFFHYWVTDFQILSRRHSNEVSIGSQPLYVHTFNHRDAIFIKSIFVTSHDTWYKNKNHNVIWRINNSN